MEKKSLINTLKSNKKANVVSAPAKNEGGTSRKIGVRRAAQARLGQLRKMTE